MKKYFLFLFFTSLHIIASANTEQFLVFGNGSKTLQITIDSKELIEVTPIQTNNLLDGHICRGVAFSSKHNALFVSALRKSDDTFRILSIKLTETNRPLSHKWLDYSPPFGFSHFDLEENILFGTTFKTGEVASALVTKNSEGWFDLKTVSHFDTGHPKAHHILVTQDNQSIIIPFVAQSNRIQKIPFDPKTGTLRQDLTETLLMPEGTGPRHVIGIKNEPYLYFSNEQQRGVSVISNNSGEPLKMLQIIDPPKEDSKPRQSASNIQYNATHDLIYSVIRNREKREYNYIVSHKRLKDGTLEKLHQTNTNRLVRNIAISSSGNYLVAGSTTDGTLEIFRCYKNGEFKLLKTIPQEQWGNFWYVTIRP